MFAGSTSKLSLPNHSCLSFIKVAFNKMHLQKDKLFITVGNILFTFTSGYTDEDLNFSEGTLI